MAGRVLVAVTLLALVGCSMGAVRTVTVAVSPQSTLASITSFQAKVTPQFAKIFSKTRTPQFLLDNFRKNQKLTLFFPTDSALARYKPIGKCAKIPMSNILAQLMVPTIYDGKTLSNLKRGTKLRTMSPVYITIMGKDTLGRVRVGVVNGYQKVVAWATVIKSDVLLNRRNFVMHHIDNILTACDDGAPIPGI